MSRRTLFHLTNPLFSESTPLIITVTLHLTNVAGKADHLVAVAELVVVPQIQDNGFAVFADLSGRCVKDAGAAIADTVTRHKLGVVAEADLLDEVAFQASDTEGLVNFLDSSGALQIQSQHSQ